MKTRPLALRRPLLAATLLLAAAALLLASCTTCVIFLWRSKKLLPKQQSGYYHEFQPYSKHVRLYFCICTDVRAFPEQQIESISYLEVRISS